MRRWWRFARPSVTSDVGPPIADPRELKRARWNAKFDEAAGTRDRFVGLVNSSSNVVQLFAAVLEMQQEVEIRGPPSDDPEPKYFQLPFQSDNALHDIKRMAEIAAVAEPFLDALRSGPRAISEIADNCAAPIESVKLALYYLDHIGVVKRARSGRSFVATLATETIAPGAVERAWTSIQRRPNPEASRI